MHVSRLWNRVTGYLFLGHDHASVVRYRILRRNIAILMLILTIIPLIIMAAINHRQYNQDLKAHIDLTLARQTDLAAHYLNRFYETRRSLMFGLAQTMPVSESDPASTLQRLFAGAVQRFDDLHFFALINREGRIMNLAGTSPGTTPEMIQLASISLNAAASAVGGILRDAGSQPLFAIAVPVDLSSNHDPKQMPAALVAAYNWRKLTERLKSLALEKDPDVFVVDRDGTLQTDSRLLGSGGKKNVLPHHNHATGVKITSAATADGRRLFLGSRHIPDTNLSVVIAQPQSLFNNGWFTRKRNLFFLFSILLVGYLIIKLSEILAKNIRDVDQRRESAFRELAHSQKLSSIGRLAAGVAHEINNPLAIINEKAGLIQDIVTFKADIDKESRYLELAQSILQSVDRCRTITHRLLGFARRLDGLIEELDINEVLEEVVGFLEKETLYRQVQIHFNSDTDLPLIYSDRGQLQQVFLNILSNALESVDTGGFTAISTWQEDAETVAIKIEDNGQGMSEETLRHIFEPFFTTKKAYGTGLGLPITYGIVTKLGGKITVDSTLGEGTVFQVLLPVTGPTDPGETGNADESQPPASGE